MAGTAAPATWYLNDRVNAKYAMTALSDGYLDMPVLFLNARYDYVRECTHSRLAEPMRTHRHQLTEETIRSDHWLAQGKAVEVNAALVKWLATKVKGLGSAPGFQCGAQLHRRRALRRAPTWPYAGSFCSGSLKWRVRWSSGRQISGAHPRKTVSGRIGCVLWCRGSYASEMKAKTQSPWALAGLRGERPIGSTSGQRRAQGKESS